MNKKDIETIFERSRFEYENSIMGKKCPRCGSVVIVIREGKYCCVNCEKKWSN